MDHEDLAEFSASVCFRTTQKRDDAAPMPNIGLRSDHADALSQLMPILVCGEESAALVFGQFANSMLADSSRLALRRISDDEVEHERLLSRIRKSLPPFPPDARSIGELRHFFKAAAHRDIGIHFTRIAALDSAVCGILAMMRASRCSIGRDPMIAASLARIHRDEARHVKIAMGFATVLTGRPQRNDEASKIRLRFARLLGQQGDALERLAIDPDRLLDRIRNVPRFFFQ
jgi:demethoxyubiquinone hydroxylase (CLK1/Coq7/Cat5 family)